MTARFEGSTALVTGGAGSIGRAVLDQLAGGGAKLAINDLDADLAQETAVALRRQGHCAVAFPGDVSQEDDVVKMIQEINKGLGPLDLVVNNAGISPKTRGGKAPLEEISTDEWDRVIGVNVTGPMLVIKHCAPRMKARGYGRIVNVASVMGKLGSAGPLGVGYGPVSPSGTHYCVSKAGLICLTKCVARELASSGITCNAVAPGAVHGGLCKELGAERIVAQIPLGRLAQPLEIACAVCFLLSAEAGYITGEILDVDGGWTMD